MKKIILTMVFGLFALFAYSQSCTYCEGATPLTLTASSTGGVGTVVYTWTSPSSTTTTGATASADEAGTWTWTATDDNSCQTSGTFDVIIIGEPAVTINALDGCAGDSQTISASGVPVGATYSWAFGSGATPLTSATATTAVFYSTGGTKTITLTLTYQTCVFTYTKVIEMSAISGSATCQ